MSFSDPGFLFNNRTTDQEREAERRQQEGLRARVQGYYRAATWLVVLTLIYVPLPLGHEVWHWQVVGAVGAVIWNDRSQEAKAQNAPILSVGRSDFDNPLAHAPLPDLELELGDPAF